MRRTMRLPGLYLEDEMDLMEHSEQGAGAWLSLLTLNTTINGDVVHQDPPR